MGFIGQGMLAPSREFLIEIVSNYLFWASSAFKMFEAGLQSLELSFRASSAFKMFEAGLQSLELSFQARSAFKMFEAGL
jgi:hypothetical protein